MASIRIERLNHTYQEEISMIIMREVKDENIKKKLLDCYYQAIAENFNKADMFEKISEKNVGENARNPKCFARINDIVYVHHFTPTADLSAQRITFFVSQVLW